MHVTLSKVLRDGSFLLRGGEDRDVVRLKRENVRHVLSHSRWHAVHPEHCFAPVTTFLQTESTQMVPSDLNHGGILHMPLRRSSTDLESADILI